jgi:hypothetical protein
MSGIAAIARARITLIVKFISFEPSGRSVAGNYSLPVPLREDAGGLLAGKNPVMRVRSLPVPLAAPGNRPTERSPEAAAPIRVFELIPGPS